MYLDNSRTISVSIMIEISLMISEALLKRCLRNPIIKLLFIIGIIFNIRRYIILESNICFVKGTHFLSACVLCVCVCVCVCIISLLSRKANSVIISNCISFLSFCLKRSVSTLKHLISSDLTHILRYYVCFSKATDF